MYKRHVVLLMVNKLSQKFVEVLLQRNAMGYCNFVSLNLYFFVLIISAAGCIPLATDGICVIHNMAVLKKDQKEKLQNGMITG